jgi:REP element-mobilizing transposase RayT
LSEVFIALSAGCEELGAEPVAVGGTDDHVHVLVRLPATLSLSELMRRIKGASAHLATHQLAPGEFFKWQGGYGAFSVSPRHLGRVRDYIARQREHHAIGSLLPTLEPEYDHADLAKYQSA